MLQVLIIDKNAKNSIKIVKNITELYTDLSIVTITDIDEAMKVIKSEKPHLVVVNLEMKDSKGRDLLECLMKWDFKILIYQDDELYEIISKKRLTQGYVLKKANK